MRLGLLLLGLAACPHRGPSPLVSDDPALAEASAPAGSPTETVRRARTASSPDLRARAWAVDLGGESIGERVVGLSDADPVVQRAVVRSLGPDAEGILVGVVANAERDPFVRAEAAIALGRDAGIAALDTHWRGGGLARAYASFRLGAPDGRAALESVLAAGDLPLEPWFFLELSAEPDPGLAAALAKGQLHVEEELAFTLAAARVRLGDPSAAEALEEGLRHADEEVRLEVVDLLNGLPSPAADGLLERARRDTSEFVATYAELVSLSRAGKAGSVFERAAASPDWEERQFAARYLQSAGASRATEKLLSTLLTDASPAVRAAAATAAGASGAAPFRAALEGLLRDGSQEVSFAAARALLTL